MTSIRTMGIIIVADATRISSILVFSGQERARAVSSKAFST